MQRNPAQWPDLYTHGAVALVSHFETPHQCSNVYFTWRENLHNISLVHLVSPMRWNPAPGITDAVKPRTLTWFVYTRGGRFGILKLLISVQTCSSTWRDNLCNISLVHLVSPMRWNPARWPDLYTHGAVALVSHFETPHQCSNVYFTWRENLHNISLVHLVSPMRWNPARWPDLYTQGAVALVSHFETPHQCSNVYFTWRENLHNISLVHLVSPMRWNPAPGVTDVVKPRTWCHRCGETPHVDLICIHTRRSLWHFETPH